jgi:hypothetical protein
LAGAKERLDQKLNASGSQTDSSSNGSCVLTVVPDSAGSIVVWHRLIVRQLTLATATVGSSAEAGVHGGKGD